MSKNKLRKYSNLKKFNNEIITIIIKGVEFDEEEQDEDEEQADAKEPFNFDAFIP